MNMHHDDILEAIPQSSSVSIRYWAFVDGLDRRSEAEQIFSIFNEFILRKRINRYYFTAVYFKAEHKDDIFEEVKSDFLAGRAVREKELYREGLIYDQLFNRYDYTLEINTPEDIYRSFKYPYDGREDQLLSDAADHLRKEYAVDVEVELLTGREITRGYHLRAHRKDDPEKVYTVTYVNGEFRSMPYGEVKDIPDAERKATWERLTSFVTDNLKGRTY